MMHETLIWAADPSATEWFYSSFSLEENQAEENGIVSPISKQYHGSTLFLPRPKLWWIVLKRLLENFAWIGHSERPLGGRQGSWTIAYLKIQLGILSTLGEIGLTFRSFEDTKFLLYH